MQYMLVCLNTNERDNLTKVQSSEAQTTSNVVLGRERERERERGGLGTIALTVKRESAVRSASNGCVLQKFRWHYSTHTHNASGGGDWMQSFTAGENLYQILKTKHSQSLGTCFFILQYSRPAIAVCRFFKRPFSLNALFLSLILL